MYFLLHPLEWIIDEKMAVHCLESGCIGLHISSGLQMSLGLRSWDISQASGYLLVVRNIQPNTSLLSAVYRYSNHHEHDDILNLGKPYPKKSVYFFLN